MLFESAKGTSSSSMCLASPPHPELHLATASWMHVATSNGIMGFRAFTCLTPKHLLCSHESPQSAFKQQLPFSGGSPPFALTTQVFPLDSGGGRVARDVQSDVPRQSNHSAKSGRSHRLA